MPGPPHAVGLAPGPHTPSHWPQALTPRQSDWPQALLPPAACRPPHPLPPPLHPCRRVLDGAALALFLDLPTSLQGQLVQEGGVGAAAEGEDPTAELFSSVLPTLQQALEPQL